VKKRLRKKLGTGEFRDLFSTEPAARKSGMIILFKTGNSFLAVSPDPIDTADFETTPSAPGEQVTYGIIRTTSIGHLAIDIDGPSLWQDENVPILAVQVKH
jgi:hypothetical protein